MYNHINNFSHYGDIIAIPFFAMLVIYFCNIKNKTPIEYILLCFSIVGLLFDIISTCIFMNKTK